MYWEPGQPQAQRSAVVAVAVMAPRINELFTLTVWVANPPGQKDRVLQPSREQGVQRQRQTGNGRSWAA